MFGELLDGKTDDELTADKVNKQNENHDNNHNNKTNNSNNK